MSEVTIRPALEADVDAVGALLGQTFALDPYAQVLFGDAEDIEQRSAELFRWEARTQYLPYGKIDIAETSHGLAGVAMWLAPTSGSTIWHRMATLPGYIKRLGSRMIPVLYSESQAERHQPTFPHWYLYLLGVSPKNQGQGIGTKLMDYRISQFGSEDAAYLESMTPGSARLYARHGFVPMGIVPLSKHKNLGMWRPAQGEINMADD